MGSVITIIIVIVAVILQITKAVREQRESSGGGDEGWWEDEGKGAAAPTAPTAPQPLVKRSPPAVPAGKPKPTPSAHVQAILRQLQQQQQQQVQAAAPRPKPVPAAPPPAARHYLDEQAVEAELAQAAKAATEQAVTEVYTQSMGAAFPLARRIRPQRQAGQRGPIRVKAHGQANLRRAILLGEVLGPPRAFDL